MDHESRIEPRSQRRPHSEPVYLYSEERLCEGQVIVGSYNTITGNRNTVFGNDNVVMGLGNVVSGSSNRVVGIRSTVIGQDNEVYGINNTVSGGNSPIRDVDDTPPSQRRWARSGRRHLSHAEDRVA